jgi:N-acetyl-gamma-glutamyl-phosphate reductase
MRTVAYASIIGASGYTGQETLDRVLAHPELELIAVGSDSLAGQPATALDPRLNRNGGRRVPVFIANDAALACEADVTFVCLGHEAAAALEPSKRGVVIDLSGAHRLLDAAQYDEWYGFSHPHPSELGDWVYGLPELVDVSGKRLVANPGCYATAALLALGPLREAIEPDGVVVDAKSGMTGAGRVPKAATHAGFVLENVSPYKVGAHQHVAEIAQLLGFPVSFAPHLLPIRRGLIATCYVQSTGPDLRSLLVAHYASSDVVTVLPEGMTPEIARVQGTDAAELGVFADRFTGRTIVVCAIDNLGKGAAGQAVQNVNRLFGFADTDGLRLSGVRV